MGVCVGACGCVGVRRSVKVEGEGGGGKREKGRKGARERGNKRRERGDHLTQTLGLVVHRTLKIPNTKSGW